MLLFLDASMESDHFMSADEAVIFGLIDKVEQPSINWFNGITSFFLYILWLLFFFVPINLIKILK